MSDQTAVDPMGEEIRQLAEDIFREKVLRARRTPVDQRIEQGPQLFDWAVRQTLDGIRHRYPDADENRVRAILAKRMRIKRRLDEAGIYHDVRDET